MSGLDDLLVETASFRDAPEVSLLKRTQTSTRTRADHGVGCPICPDSGPRADAFKRMSKEDPGANQAHHCRHCFDHSEHTLLRPT
ncbi:MULTISPECIES: hypothetical protein [unclassified Bradyrhizobium]|uniref:hypothetical protein n=1 Tax=unclassified Bradyrhizobium TaxID=2631580 RepID=UPI0029168749|nr:MULTISPECIES: hypothetical protein [unclassified Bradyrhizobium]